MFIVIFLLIVGAAMIYIGFRRPKRRLSRPAKVVHLDQAEVDKK